MGELTLLDLLGHQTTRLCGVTGMDPVPVRRLLTDLLGPAGRIPRSHGPAWPSDVADDHTPVEFSVAFHRHGGVTLRLLAEALAAPPGTVANLAAAHRFLDAQTARLGLDTSRFAMVRDLFAAPDPEALFALWFSFVFNAGRQPEIKIYLNPELRGVGRSADVVAEAAERLGIDAAYRTVLDRACRPGELGRGDRLTFFALDLHDGPHTRIKLYVSQHDAEIPDVLRAASVVDGVDAGDLAAFCTTAGGGSGPFGGRPLVSSYTFTPGVDKPIGYSIYVPIRSYVRDDEEARHRVSVLLDRYGFGAGQLDAVIDAVTQRPLRAGTGLIAHASLRLGPPSPGMTVYLSSEAYETAPPRPALWR